MHYNRTKDMLYPGDGENAIDEEILFWISGKNKAVFRYVNLVFTISCIAVGIAAVIYGIV